MKQKLYLAFSSHSSPPQAIKNWQDAKSSSRLRAVFTEMILPHIWQPPVVFFVHDNKSFILGVKATTLEAEFSKLLHHFFEQVIYVQNKHL